MELLIACHECDLLHQSQSLPPGGTARCVRCGAVLYRRKRNSLDRVLALTIAGLVLFLVANAYPFLTFKLEAQVQETTLISGVIELYAQGMWIVAGVVLMTSILMPLLELIGMLYILLPLKFNLRPWKLPVFFRLVRRFKPWGMMEVFMLGILVAYVKLAKMASLIPGTALYAFLALIFVLAASAASLDPHIVWNRFEKGS
ncbi:MAG: paraquat-inducible protein A [Desulfobacterales bacterium]|jgi:paraquat-inducible protein A